MGMDAIISLPGLATTAITGTLTLTKSGSTARVATFLDASGTVPYYEYAGTWTAAQTFQNGGAGLPRTTISQTGDNPIIDQYRWTGGGVLYWASRHILIGSDLAWQNAPSATLGAHSFVTRMTLDGAGNLGIGVTPNAWSGTVALQFTGGSLNSFGSGPSLNQNCYYDGTNWRYIAAGYAARYAETNSSGHIWYLGGNASAGTVVSFSTAMQLNASGQLVIGTNPGLSAGELLGVGGSIRAGQALVLSYAGASIDMPNSGAGSSSISYGIWAKSSVGLAIRSANSGRIDFDDGTGSVYMRIGTNMFGIFGSAGSMQITGFGTPTGASRLANFPGATATLGQQTAAFADLIQVLKSYGIIGA